MGLNSRENYFRLDLLAVVVKVALTAQWTLAPDAMVRHLQSNAFALDRELFGAIYIKESTCTIHILLRNHASY
jgi:hypothetical protein